MPLNRDLEAQLPSLDAHRAAEALLRGYGGELYSFLLGTLRGESDADEAFSMFCEQLWRGLEGFRGEGSYRTWAYQVARRAAYQVRRGDFRRSKRFNLDGGEAAERIAAEIRTTTAAFRRTDVKDKMRALRDELSDEDKELLVLRLDRDLEWQEIATILDEDAANLRKRFERLKSKLKVMAKRAGLLPEA
jgi:RNA polymerase sigma-70 factor, ECF subfamily